MKNEEKQSNEFNINENYLFEKIGRLVVTNEVLVRRNIKLEQELAKEQNKNTSAKLH
jgi:hypothetical protein